MQAALAEAAAAAEMSSKPSDTLSDLYADIDESKIKIIEDNSYKGDGRGLPTHLDPVSSPLNAPETTNEQPVGQPSSPGVEMSRREHTPPRRTIGDMTGLDLDDDMFGAGIDMDSSLEDVGPGSTSALKSYNSSFTMSNFRRRDHSRTSSFVGASNNASTRPGSRRQNTTSVSSTLNLAMFKRRAREPSILSTTQKKKSFRHEERESSSEASDTTEHDDSGNAEARNEEGSPMCCKGARTPAVSPSSKSSGIDVSEFQSRKRKFSDAPSCIADDVEPPSKAHPLVPDHHFSQQGGDILYPSSSVPASPRSPSPVVQIDNQEEDAAILAPPASSDSSEPELPPLQTITRRGRPPASRRTPQPLEFDEGSSNIPSPPSLTHSPNYPPLRATKKEPPRQQQKKKDEIPTTVELAGMLARRHRRRHHNMRREDNEASGNDVNLSSSSDNDSDVSYLEIRRPRKRPATTVATTATVKASSSLKSLSLSGGGGCGGNNPSSKTTKGAVDPRKRRRRTYGSKGSPSAEKENTEQGAERSDADDGNDQHGYGRGNVLSLLEDEAHFDDEPSEILERRLGLELKMAKRKFQEVDKWDLVFEDVQRSSSPAGAR